MSDRIYIELEREDIRLLLGARDPEPPEHLDAAKRERARGKLRAALASEGGEERPKHHPSCVCPDCKPESAEGVDWTADVKRLRQISEILVGPDNRHGIYLNDLAKKIEAIPAPEGSEG